ncbi:MAG: NCS2 family permease [Kiritimatiellae bacterium]|nr:NCS2 family permease [Kiritimatiellia bacterium]
MATEDVKASIAKLEKSILEDGKVDRAEAQILLAFAKPRTADNAEMAEFVKLLESVLEDGVVTPDESVRVGAYLKWLTREVASEEPETGFLGRLFKLKRNRTTVKTEIVAGITTFMTMAYILAVNPNLLSMAGIPRGGVFLATAIASVVGTLLMAGLSNYPFVLAPGMGLNAFLTFGVCFGMGYSWQFALLAVFVEGIVFLALSLTPVRESIFNAIPFTLKKAVAAGIGLFICFIALQTSGVIVNNDATLVGLISFKAGGVHTVCAILALMGTIFTGFLLVKGVKGAILIGILATWVMGMICQATGIYVPDPAAKCFSLYPNFSFEGIAQNFKEFGQTVCALFGAEGWTHSVKGADGAMKVVGSGWDLIKSLDFFVVMFAFFFVDLFDTLGTLIGVSMKGGFLTKEGKLPRISGALCADSIATSLGAVLGTSTTTTYVESASGVMAGGRTGLTAVTSAAFFALAILFAPVFLAIPAFATAPALIIVGYMMLSSCTDIDFRDAGEAVPAFLAIVGMPFAYSISDGIMFGVISYTVINALCGNFKRIHWIMYILTALFIAKYALM